MDTKEVMESVKEFSKLAEAHGLSLHEQPVLTINKSSASRTDSIDNIAQEIYQTGLSKEINIGGGKIYLVGSAVAASAHTTSYVENEGQDTPLHYVMWWMKKGFQGMESSNFSDLARLPANARKQIFDALGWSTFRTIKKMEEMMEGSPNQDFSSPLLYGAVGHTPLIERDDTGLGRGVPSHPNGHLHSAVFTPEQLRQDIEIKPVTSAEVLQQISPFNNIFFETTKDAIVRKLQNKYGRILDVKTTVDHNYHPEFGGISFFDGFDLKFKKPAEFAEAMEVLTKFISESQQIYGRVLEFYGDYYQHIAEPEAKNRIAGQCISLLQSFGCTEEEAALLQKQIFSLSPTFAQVRSWVEAKNTIGDDPNKKELEGMLVQYQKIRGWLNNPQQRAKIRRIYMQYDLNEKEADILLLMVEDNLKDPQEGEYSHFTMPGQLSLGYSFDYELTDDRVVINGITLATLFSEKHILERTVPYVFKRN